MRNSNKGVIEISGPEKENDLYFSVIKLTWTAEILTLNSALVNKITSVSKISFLFAHLIILRSHLIIITFQVPTKKMTRPWAWQIYQSGSNKTR
jgi:hypothetical protein